MSAARYLLAFIALLILILALLFVAGNARDKRERESCESRGGEYMLIHDSGVCFAPGVILPEKKS